LIEDFSMADGETRVDKPRTPPPPGVPPDPFERDLSHEFVAVAAEPLAQSAGEDLPPVVGTGIVSIGGDGRSRRGDRIFAGLTSGASGLIILIVVLIAVFLLVKSVPSILDDKANFLTSTQWSTAAGDLAFGVAALAYTTVMLSLLALLIAVPLSIGIALFITHYAPARFARPVAHVVDLLAAIPSIIYGIWGIRVLAPHLVGVQNAITGALGSIPLFGGKNIDTGTLFDGAIVLAIMVLPIITAISRDVFERTPTANIEAALALGATRWEMIRMAVLPFGRAGVVSGAMLGLGRALGETIAIYIILSKVSKFDPSIFSGGESFASKIANNAAEFGRNPGPYIAAGLVLFVLTFVVNTIARGIVSRRKEFS
jgi:phosphate transport system permease protein